MKGKVLLFGFVLVLLSIVGKFSLYETVTFTYNAILPFFQGLERLIEYGLSIFLCVLGFLVIVISIALKPKKTEVKWTDEKGEVHTKSTNKYLIGMLIGLILIFLGPISQLISMTFLSFDSYYIILIVLASCEGIGWLVGAIGLGTRVISKCYNCNKLIDKGKEIKCRDCGNKFCSNDCYEEHLLYTHDKCAVCNRGFGREARYETCPECSKLKFCSINCLKEHQKLKH